MGIAAGMLDGNGSLLICDNGLGNLLILFQQQHMCTLNTVRVRALWPQIKDWSKALRRILWLTNQRCFYGYSTACRRRPRRRREDSPLVLLLSMPFTCLVYNFTGVLHCLSSLLLHWSWLCQMASTIAFLHEQNTQWKEGRNKKSGRWRFSQNTVVDLYGSL